MHRKKTDTTGHRRVLAVLWLCLAAVFLGVGRPALAQGSNPWQVQETIPSLKNSNTYVLWVKNGTTDSTGNYSGDMASIWTVDATGHQMAISPTYGPYPGWMASQLSPAFDGTLRMAWTMDSGKTGTTRRTILSFWALDVTANRTSVSPTYGPYTDWHFVEFFPNPDGTSSLYWEKNSFDGNGTLNGTQLSIWAVDAVGSQLSISQTYGPYAGWFVSEGFPSLNKDGTVFVVWVNPGKTDNNGNYSGDQVSVWKTDSRGNQTSIGPTYGRYPGWHFSELFPSYDGTARLLWTLLGTTDGNGNYSGDTASIWTMDATGHETTISPTYGPYAGWTANGLFAAPSSTSRLLWILPGATDINGNFTGDQASIWTLNAADVQTSISPTYSASGGGTVDSLTVMPDGSERLSWDYGANSSSTQFSLWSLDASNNRTATGPVYGPFP